MDAIFTVQNLITGLAVFLVAWPAVYGLGWAWSRGYHRGKREFLSRLYREHCRGE